MRDHRQIDKCALEFDRLVAGKLRKDPSLLKRARANLSRWERTASPASRKAFAEWAVLLEGPINEVFRVLEGTDERAVRLRQSSPFCGILTRHERTQVLLDHR